MNNTKQSSSKKNRPKNNPKKPNKFGVITIDETRRIEFQQQLSEFSKNEEPDLKFPSSLTKDERAYVHQLAEQMGFKSRSHGNGDNRALTISKMSNRPVQNQSDDVRMCRLQLDNHSTALLHRGNHEEPLDMLKLTNLQKTSKANVAQLRQMSDHPYGANVTVPQPARSDRFQSTRNGLPIAAYQSNILDVINSNQVVVVAGETGSGKTTQVSQYVMEDARMKNLQCRIICTQPRRLAAISIAERVASERGESVGQTVGYQVRLESRTSNTTNLILTTTGYFTRCLMGGSADDVLSSLTHIFLDEVHERDSHVDFLMITIRDALRRHSHLKLVLMSATMDTDIFGKYFFDCPVLKIPGRMFVVEKFYLEHILQFVQFPKSKESNSTKKVDKIVLSAENQSILDEILHKCFLDTSGFDEFYDFVNDKNIHIDSAHSDTKMTALSIAAYHGDCSIIESLLLMGADVCRAVKDKNALQIAELCEQWEAVDILRHHWERKTEDGDLGDILTDDQRSRLRAYEGTINADDGVDLILVFELIAYIHANLGEGSILIFLTGYAEIMDMYEILQENTRDQNFQLHMLHSRIKSEDHRKVFAPPKHGYRKIILSTNIAETSLTIDDVAFVIDTGKVKQKTFDAVSATTSLTSTWISKACAEQRAGRAGRTRPGKCFRTYTQKRFEAMEQFTIPEILRVPLTELCLQAKSIAVDVNITDFLGKAIQPPPAISVKRSIKLLQTINALTEDENLTYLGLRLADIPLDPQLGKCLLYSVVFGCLDPVLTIVSTLSASEPFVLPTLARDKRIMADFRSQMAGESLSDHYTLLNIYQEFNKMKVQNMERQWCKSNYISYANMDTIDGIRSQLMTRLKMSGLIRKSLPECNKFSHKWGLVKMCLAAGLYPNVCTVDKSQGAFRSGFENKLSAATGSVFYANNPKAFQMIVRRCRAPWIIFVEKTRNLRYYQVKNNTGVSSLAIALVAGSSCTDKNLKIQHTLPGEVPTIATLEVDEWISFTGDIDEIQCINDLRMKIHMQFLMYAASPVKYFKFAENSNLAHLASSVLECQENLIGLWQPDNIGCAPKAYNSRNRGGNSFEHQQSNQQRGHIGRCSLCGSRNIVANMCRVCGSNGTEKGNYGMFGYSGNGANFQPDQNVQNSRFISSNSSRGGQNGSSGRGKRRHPTRTARGGRGGGNNRN